MTRNHRSAKKAGTSFERSIADCLATHVDERIDRRVRTGKDRGDLAGIRVHGQRVVVECKNTTRLALGEWMGEAEDERGNDDALVGLIVHKRHGKGDPLDQWCTFTVRELVALLRGQRIEEAS